MLIIGLLSLQLNAQERWTLNNCINYAIKNNLRLKDVKIHEESAGINYRQSKWNLLPGLAAGTDASMNYGRSVDLSSYEIVTNSFFYNSYYLGTSVELFRGFMLQNQIRYQKFRKEAAENNRLNATDDLAFEVMNAFFNVIYYEELLKIANDQKTISQMNLKKTEVLVNTGLKAQTDLLEVKANYEKDELFCIQTANHIASSWIDLRKAINLPLDEQITLIIPQDSPVAEILNQLPELYNQHIGRSPYIKTFESEYDASRKMLSMSRSAFFPSIRLQAAYNTKYIETNKDAQNKVIAFNSQIKNNRSQFVGASLSIPIFSRNAVRFDVKRAKLALEQSNAKLELAKQTIRYEMEENYNELNASWKELQQSKIQMEADTLTFQAAQKKFDQGMINAVELYTIKNRLANTASQVLHYRLTYELKKRIIEFYEGKRFWESPS